MSVPAQTPITGPYTANGNTKQFAYQFYLLQETDLVVYLGGIKKTLHTDYEVTGIGQTQGGNVVFTVNPPQGAEVLLKRQTPYTRNTDYADNGDLLADVLNQDFDRLWLSLQEINANFGSSISRPVGGNWDADLKRITRVADGVQPQDAVTYKQLFTVEGNAAAAADAASQSATVAAQQASTATGAASTATGAASAANTSASDAQKWAANPVDSVVANGLYSARHYASKAAGSATSAASSESTATTAAGTATTAAGTATTAATTATQQADRAKTEADKLANNNALAATIDSITGSDVKWKGKQTVAVEGTDNLDLATFRQVVQAKSDAKSANTNFSVLNGAATAPANGVNVSGGAVASKYQVAGVDYVTAELRAQAQTGTPTARSAAIDIGDGATKKTWLFGADGVITNPDVPWITPAGANGWSVVSQNLVRTGYRKRLGVVEISINMQANGPKNDGIVMFTVPAGYRPTSILSFLSSVSDMSTLVRVDITPNGDVTCQGYSGTQRNCRLHISYPVDM